MPRREAFEADSGDDGLMAQPDRFGGVGASGYAASIANTGSATTAAGGAGTSATSTTLTVLAAAASMRGGQPSDDPELRELERRLNEEVDEEFFEEPRKFSTLQRVLDVLGFQMDDITLSNSSGAGAAGGLDMIAKNPAYRQLKSQQEIVEGAIEHMAVIHCADLNGSVIQVGRVARQFSEAVHKVRVLRRQVRDIQDGLGHGASAPSNPNEPRTTGVPPPATSTSRPQNAAAMSLRELWLKKLECEATLSLLDKLDVVRAAPAKFDACLQPPHVRIGAAVLVLSDALSTMFSDDIAQVGALHKIMEQLMLRKQRAEEIVWETVSDVVYLRTGNAFLYKQRPSRYLTGIGRVTNTLSSSHSVSSESRRSASRNTISASRQTASKSDGSVVSTLDGMVNPFVGKTRRSRFALDSDLDERSSEEVTTTESSEDDDDDDESGASLFSLEEEDDELRPLESGLSAEPSSKLRKATLSSSKSVGSVPSSMAERSASGHPHRIGGAAGAVRMMIPIPIVEAELDLEEDERRCLEEIAFSRGGGGTSSSLRTFSKVTRSHHHGAGGGNRSIPRYLNPVLASKILIECLFLLKRLDDVERVLGEGLEREIRRIVQREQARTFSRLERLKRKQVMMVSTQRIEANLQEFRQHLTGLLSAFGTVMIRLSHLAEILRFRIGTDKGLLQKFGSPSSVMRSVLSLAYDIMQREIKSFLRASLVLSETSRDSVLDPSSQGSRAYEKNLFSLGIVENSSGPGSQSMSTATRTNVMEMSTPKFVVNVLCAKTKVDPQIHHALSFRRSVAHWTHENDSMKRELAALTGEDTTAPTFNASNEESAIAYLDKVIQKELLPALQEEAVNGTVKGLEHRDAFDPVLDRTLYSRPGSNDPQDVDMCKACQAMYDSTSPLFLALHRLPPGGEMYMPLVAVLEHVMLTFISRVKQQVGRICNKKTASTLLEEDDTLGTISSIAEKRRPFALLLRAYAGVDATDASHLASGDPARQASTGLMPLSPPSTDTAPRKSPASELKTDIATLEDLSDGIEGEEHVFLQELGLLYKLLDFDGSEQGPNVSVCSDEELMKAACLAHSLLKLASLLGGRLRARSDSIDKFKTLTSTRTLQEAIRTIHKNGIRMAKFCRFDMLLQALTRMAKVPSSSTLVARDAVRIPSSVNDLGEYLTSASDNLREACGNAVTAYTFSSLEQYIPHFLMRVVRLVAQGKGVIAKALLTMNGIESLDRSGSVLYRDLKGATSFDNSFWDVELAAISFERSASFIALMELEMEELVTYYTSNREDFAEDDFILMFSMTGPRRRGDVGQYHMLKRRFK